MLKQQELRQIEDAVKKAFEIGKDELMNISQCAKWLEITKEALRQRCENGKIPFHKKHGLFYFSKNEITKYYTRNGQ